MAADTHSSMYNPFITLTILCTIAIYIFWRGSTTFVWWQVAFCDSIFAQKSKWMPSFATEMANFEWQPFNDSVIAKNASGIKLFATKLFLDLIPFLTRPPSVPLNLSCRASSLKLPFRFQNKCRKLAKPRRVGVLIQFAFEVDTLEIHFNELDDVVDKFFLMESIQPHSPYVKHKPLVWDSLKNDERFAAFAPKVVHFILDDAHLQHIDKRHGKYAKEKLQEKLRWSKFLEWNEVTGFFSNSDILGFGDVDEVPYRNNIYYLKNCELDHDPIDIGIWFPWASIDTIIATDWPVKGDLFTLGDPTFWTLGKALGYHNTTGNYPSRNRGKSTGYLFGGMHLSHYSYPPYRIAKVLTAGESSLKRLEKVIKAGSLYTQGNISSAEEMLIPPMPQKTVLTLDDYFEYYYRYAREIVRIPWLYKCNRRRYPAFELKHDKRLD